MTRKVTFVTGSSRGIEGERAARIAKERGELEAPSVCGGST